MGVIGIVNFTILEKYLLEYAHIWQRVKIHDQMQWIGSVDAP